MISEQELAEIESEAGKFQVPEGEYMIDHAVLALTAEIRRLRAALAYYADPDTYDGHTKGPYPETWPADGKILDDEGAKAREVLK